LPVFTVTLPLAPLLGTDVVEKTAQVTPQSIEQVELLHVFRAPG